MHKHTLLIAGLFASVSILPLAAHAADNTNDTISTQDEFFANAARQGDQTEIVTSQAAEDRSKNPDIRNFAKKMISDHTYIDDQLKKAIEGTDISLPADFDPPHQMMVDHVKGASDADFDRDYIMGQDKAHQEAISAFQTEANTGINPRLKALAAQTLPVLQDHLAMLMKIEQSPQFAAMAPSAGTPTTTMP
jgi:putative membrane protein